jgi:putative MATE family efflux protein
MSETKENKMGTMPVNKLLISMALPMMISMLVQAMYNIVDSVFVAKISENALTAVTLAFPLQTLLISMGTGLGVGMNAILSRNLGAKNMQGVKKAALNALVLTAIVYIIALLIGLFAVDAFLRSQTDITEIIEYGDQYLRIVCIFSFGFLTQMCFERMLQATGKTIYTMVTQMTGAVINIILDPILIFGLLGAPKLGIRGAAIATVIGQCIAGVMALVINLKKNHEIDFSLKGFIPEWSVIKQILYIGVPSIIMSSIGSVMTFGMNKILLGFTPTAAAVFGVYFKLQSFIFMPVFGLNNGMVPIIAYSYGARRRDRMMKTIKLSVMYALCLMIIGLAVMQIFPKQLLALFSASDDMVRMGVPALRTISLHFVFAAFSIICLSTFQALGYGLLSMSVSIMRQLIFLLPSAYILSLTGNVDNIWFSFLIAEGMAVVTSLMLFRFVVYKRTIKTLDD